MAEARTCEAGTTLAPLTSGVVYQYCNNLGKVRYFCSVNVFWSVK